MFLILCLALSMATAKSSGFKEEVHASAAHKQRVKRNEYDPEIMRVYAIDRMDAFLDSTPSIETRWTVFDLLDTKI